jgi:hypothetical protein
MIRYILAAMLFASPALAQTGNLSGGTVKATGAITSRSLANRAAEVVNVKDGYGAVAGAAGDTVGVSGCSIAAAGTLLTCSSATFSSADTGKRYYLQGTGTANVPQTGTITYVSGTTVTLSNAAVVASPQGGIYSAPHAPVTIASAGSGYTNGTQTLTITGGTCTTQPQVSVTVAGNVVTAVLGMINPGVCSNVPGSAAATTGGGGTGATFNTSGFSVAGRLLYGTDDTAAVTAAAARAVATGKKLYFPSGGYWLATQTTSIPINNIAVEGDGAVSYGWPFIGKGSWVLIDNQSTPAFSGMQGVDWSGLSVYYPRQDNSTVAPIAFPATFSSSLWVDTTIRDSRFPNSYDLAAVTNVSGSGLGRVIFDNIRAYCVRYCFNYANGQADTLTIGSNNYFGPGAADNEAPYGPANLGRFTATSGEFMRIAVGAGAYPYIDGLMLTGFIVQGMRYGIRVASGRVGVSNIANLNWDAVQTPYSIEGSSLWVSTSISGGTIYSINLYDAAASGDVYSVTSTGQVDLAVASGNVQYAVGDIFSDTGSGLRKWTISGMALQNFGRTTTAGTYYAIRAGAASSGSGYRITASGNTILCNHSGSVQKSGIGITSSASVSATLTGNTTIDCWNDVLTAGSAGLVTVTGHISTGALSTSLRDVSTSDMRLIQKANVWSSAPILRPPVLSLCGTSPSVFAGGTNERGIITIGSGVVTACRVTFTTTLPQQPICTVSSNSVTIPVSVSAVSTTLVDFSFGASFPGGLLLYQCAY